MERDAQQSSEEHGLHEISSQTVDDDDVQRPSLRGAKSTLHVHTSAAAQVHLQDVSEGDSLALSAQRPLHPAYDRATSASTAPSISSARGRGQNAPALDPNSELHPAVLEAFLRTLPALIADEGGGSGDGLGHITGDQFLRYAVRLGANDAQAERLLDAMDSNGDGNIDLTEVQEAAEQANEQLPMSIQRHLAGRRPANQFDPPDVDTVASTTTAGGVPAPTVASGNESLNLPASADGATDPAAFVSVPAPAPESSVPAAAAPAALAPARLVLLPASAPAAPAAPAALAPARLVLPQTRPDATWGSPRVFLRRPKLPEPVVQALLDNLPLVLDCSNVLDMFELLDRDRSGTLQRGEFVAAVVPLLSIDEYQAEQMFEALDVAGAGEIGLVDFMRLQGGAAGGGHRATAFRDGAVPPPPIPQWRKWMQAFAPALPHHPSPWVSLTGLVLAFFWRTSPDLIARQQATSQVVLKAGERLSQDQKNRARRASALPPAVGQGMALGGRDSTCGLDTISVDDFCDQAEEELVAHAAEVATEVRLLQNELRQVRLKTRQLRILQKAKTREATERMRKHETLTDTLWNSLDAAKHGLDPFIRAHDLATEKQRLAVQLGLRRRTSLPGVGRFTSNINLRMTNTRRTERMTSSRRTDAANTRRGGVSPAAQTLRSSSREHDDERFELRNDAGGGSGGGAAGRRLAALISTHTTDAPPKLEDMPNDSADELQRLGIVPAPWTVFVPMAGAETRVRHATFAAVALLVWFLLFLAIELSVARSNATITMPLPLRVCQLSLLNGGLGWVMLALAVVIVPVSVVLIARAFQSNINWPAIVFLILANNVWMIVLETAIRSVLIILAYSNEADPAGYEALVERRTCGASNTSSVYSFFFELNVDTCLTVTILHALLHFYLLIACVPTRPHCPWRHVAYSPQLTALGATWQVHAHGSAQSQGALLAAVARRDPRPRDGARDLRAPGGCALPSGARPSHRVLLYRLLPWQHHADLRAQPRPLRTFTHGLWLHVHRIAARVLRLHRPAVPGLECPLLLSAGPTHASASRCAAVRAAHAPRPVLAQSATSLHGTLRLPAARAAPRQHTPLARALRTARGLGVECGQRTLGNTIHGN